MITEITAKMIDLNDKKGLNLKQAIFLHKQFLSMNTF